MNRNDDVILISEKNKIIKEKDYKINNLIEELRRRDGQYKELLNQTEQQEEDSRILWHNLEEVSRDADQQEEQIEKLERKLEWADKKLSKEMSEVSKYSNLVDDLMKVISILVSSRVEDIE